MRKSWNMIGCLHFFHWIILGSALQLAGAVAQTAVPLPELRRAGNAIEVFIQYSTNPQFWANIAYSTLGRRMIANPGWTAYEKATSTSQFTGGIGQTSGIPPRGFFRMSVVLR